MIPKIIHQIWIGQKEIPKQELRWIETWKKYHPDWEHKLWTNTNLPKNIPINCQQTIDSLFPKYALIADVYRYIILAFYGGIYVDTDIECYKSINNLCITNFLGIIPRKNVNYITNAFFGCSTQNEILVKCIENLKPIQEKKFDHAYAYTAGLFLTNQISTIYNLNLTQYNIQNLINTNIKIIDYTYWQGDEAYMKHYFKASHIKVKK